MPIYSHSKLECFENCPLNYKLAYVDNIKREEQGIEAFLGSRFHELMQILYKDLKCKIYTLEELLNIYEREWGKEYSDSVIITKKDRTAEDYKNIGRHFIEDYYKRYYPFNQSRVLGLEREVQIYLKGDGRYRLKGYIDRLCQDESGVYEIHDYKTSGYIPEQKYFDKDRQLALYQIGLKDMWNDVKDVKLVWHYIAFDKEITSTRTKEELEGLKDQIAELINRIENEKEFLPCETNLCDWCVYPDLCPKRKHLYKVAALPVNEYLKEDGVRLVNAFANLNKEKKVHQKKIDLIEEEIDKVKDAVMQYAEKEGADIIRGSNKKLKISKKQKVSPPSKDSPERKELERIIKEADKWDEVSDLDVSRMEKVINEKKWGENLLDKIRRFFTVEIKKYVTISKLKEDE